MLLRPYYRIDPLEWLLTSNADVSAAQRRAVAHPNLGEIEIEEYVRQWLLRELIASYSYPAEWLGERIIVEETVPVATADKESDVSIKNDRGRTFIFLETKNAGCAEAEMQRAERQLETYLSATHTATVGLLTNGTVTRVIRKKVNPNDFEYIADIPHYGASERGRSRLARDLAIVTGGRGKVGLEPLPARYQNILFDAHSSVRDIDGLHDDNALDELCKVIYTKIYDERMVSQSPPGVETEFRFQAYGRSSASEVAADIRDLYKDACEYDLQIYSQRIPNYARSRGVFKEQIGLSDVALSRVVEILQDYSIVDASVSIKGAAFQKVLGSAIRHGMGQYFTPDPIVDIAVEVVQPRVRDLILDPFSGSGHFLSQSLNFVEREYGASTDAYVMHQFKMFHLHGIEKSPRMVRIAMTDMLMHDDGHSNIRNTDALLTFDNYPDILGLPDDDNRDPAVFDVILTNPPFGSLMREEARKMLGRFELGKKKKSLPLEVLAIERCLQFLKPGGKLAIVLPDGNLANSNVQFVRDWLLDNAMLRGVVSLPNEAFAPFGTATKTSLCFFQKPLAKVELDEDYEIAFYKLENVGYDATGRLRDGSEIADCTEYMKANVKWGTYDRT
jgi:type I restriction enzyme M protein